MCARISIQCAAFDFAAATVSGLFASNAFSGLSAASLMDTLAACQQPGLAACSRVESLELIVDDFTPPYVRGLSHVNPATCLAYMLRQPALFHLNVSEDSIPFLHFSLPSSPNISITLLFTGNRGSGAAENLPYQALICLCDDSPAPGRTSVTLASAGQFSSLLFQAEERVVKLYDQFCTLSFMESIWTRLSTPAATISSDDWMVFLGLDGDAAVTIQSFEMVDPTLGPLFCQTAKLWAQLVEYLQSIFTTRLRAIRISPISHEFVDSCHVVVVHPQKPRLAVMLRNESRRIYAYTISGPPIIGGSNSPADDGKENSEIIAEIVNSLCVFLWSRLVHHIA